MDIAYLDSSAIVKRYIPEVGSAWVESLHRGDLIVVSAIALVEVTAAVTRRMHEGLIDEKRRDEIITLLPQDFEDTYVIGVRNHIIEDAVTITSRMPAGGIVHALDAIHLACARRAFSVRTLNASSTMTFVSSDHRLLAAAQHLGMPTDNPENHP